jgi:hypothetical protein
MVDHLPIWSHNNQQTANSKAAKIIVSKLCLHREKEQQQHRFPITSFSHPFPTSHHHPPPPLHVSCARPSKLLHPVIACDFAASISSTTRLSHSPRPLTSPAMSVFHNVCAYVSITCSTLTQHVILITSLPNHTRDKLTPPSAGNHHVSPFSFFPAKILLQNTTVALARYVRTEPQSTSSPQRPTYIHSKRPSSNTYMYIILGP